MRAEKLQNLLVTLDRRLERIDKSLQRAGFGETTWSVGKELFAIRGLVRRHLSKPDALRLDDVQNLEQRIDSLRDAGNSDSLGFAPASPAARELSAIFADNGNLKNLTAGMRIGLVQLTPEDVLEATPGQKTAAYQFGFSNGTLTLVDQPLRPLAEEAGIAMAALATAIEHGQYVNEDLVMSNASPRLRSAFTRLHDTMLAYANIVQVGSCAQLCHRQVLA